MKGGTTATGTVTLASPAGPAGVRVYLSRSGSKAASVPSTVDVPAGATTANFAVKTTAVKSAAQVVVSAKTTSTVQTATLAITP